MLVPGTRFPSKCRSSAACFWKTNLTVIGILVLPNRSHNILSPSPKHRQQRTTKIPRPASASLPRRKKKLSRLLVVVILKDSSSKAKGKGFKSTRNEFAVRRSEFRRTTASVTQTINSLRWTRRGLRSTRNMSAWQTKDALRYWA